MRFRAGLALAAVLAAGCVSSGGPSGDRAPLPVVVHAGGSIQKAVDRAPSGTVIEVEPGVYPEAVTVHRPGITLRGLVVSGERPVLDGGGTLRDGVIASGSSFTMTGFRVQHYRGNGVSTQGVEGVLLADLEITDTGLYGVYPVESRDVVVSHSMVSGARDAGIYVGVSTRALVTGSDVHDNVVGIQIENTNDAVVEANVVRGNAIGIVALVAPGKVQKEARGIRIEGNQVTDNTASNAADPLSTTGQLPAGIGILLMGADDVWVADNAISGNPRAGIAILSAPARFTALDPDIEPRTDRARIASGQAPGSALVWDGSGTDNCVLRSGDEGGRSNAAVAVLPACDPRIAVEREMGSSTSPARAPSQGMPDGTPAIPADAAIVRIRDMRFEPRALTVHRGQSVVWINDDRVSHTVTSAQGTTPTRSPLNSPFLGPGDRYLRSFTDPGTFEYLCLPHIDREEMRGARVMVLP